MEPERCIERTKTFLEILQESITVLKREPLSTEAIIALQKLNTLEFFLKQFLKWNESDLKFQKKMLEIKK